MAGNWDRELRRLLKASGCWMERMGRGSHEIWRSPKTDRPFAVPINIKSRHTANAVLKQAGLEKYF
jgi:predicted RNA binding protein YcfA (HicA-like mRNA interferase family)